MTATAHGLFRATTEERKAYARGNHSRSGCHYLMTSEGHVWLDCRENRKLAREMQLDVIWTTRHAD